MYNPNARSQAVTTTNSGSMLTDCVDSRQLETLRSSIAEKTQVLRLARPKSSKDLPAALGVILVTWIAGWGSDLR